MSILKWTLSDGTEDELPSTTAAAAKTVRSMQRRQATDAEWAKFYSDHIRAPWIPTPSPGSPIFIRFSGQALKCIYGPKPPPAFFLRLAVLRFLFYGSDEGDVFPLLRQLPTSRDSRLAYVVLKKTFLCVSSFFPPRQWSSFSITRCLELVEERRREWEIWRLAYCLLLDDPSGNRSALHAYILSRSSLLHT